MRFTELAIPGAFIIEMDRHTDDHGYSARTFCREEFTARGLKPPVLQCNAGFTSRKGTIRGLHYQLAPAAEMKLIRCVRGAVYEVIVDMRSDSPTFLQYCGVELAEKNLKQLYIPGMCAAGLQSLADDSEIAYQTGEFYSPGHERGLRYDDPAIAIHWPLPLTCISEKDARWPLLDFANRRSAT
jgi:dTDP-4-dehydrorhamnose 3,5-epimerase